MEAIKGLMTDPMLGSVSELGVGCRLERAWLVGKVVLADGELNSTVFGVKVRLNLSRKVGDNSFCHEIGH